MFAFLCFLALGGKSGNGCFQRLYPSGITADSQYSSSYPAENLLRDDTSEWRSQSGDTYDNVYISFSSEVDIQHVMIWEGNYWVGYIYVYDDVSGVQKSHTDPYDGSGADYRVYNLWFTDFITKRVRILFGGSEGNYLRVTQTAFWGCNLTITAAPTVSPTMMPTNSTPTVEPTTLPSVSPTQMPTNSTPSVQPTMLPTVSPTKPPSMQPTLSPSMAPTSTLVPSSSPTMTPTSSLLPTTSPTLYPTLESTTSNEGAVTTVPDGDSFLKIGVAEFLGVLIFVLLIILIYVCIKQYKRSKVFQSANLMSMQETHEMQDKL